MYYNTLSFQIIPAMEETNKTIYIGNLPENCTLENIIEIFSPYGQITHFRFATNHFTQENMNFAFVKLDSAHTTTKAVSELNDSVYFGKFLIVKLAENEE